MELQVGCSYVNADGEIIQIIGSESMLETVYYDRLGQAYMPDGWPWNGQHNKRLISIVQ